MSVDTFPQIAENETFEDVPTNDWTTPKTIEGALPAAAPYDSEMMPPAFRVWIADTADRMQCPPDYLAATLLTLCGSIIGSRCAVKPKALDSWSVVPNLWGMIIGDPSQLKTPSVSEAMRFLSPLIDQARCEHKTKKTDYDLKKMAYDSDCKRLAAEMKGKDKAKRDKANEAMAGLKATEPHPPTMKRYKVNDCTPEKLAELCAENPQGLLSFRDEVVGLLQSFNKQGHEAARGFYLEAWTGTNPFTIDRVMKGSFFIENLCLSVFGTTQPDKIRFYLNDARQGNNDGLIQRFQIMVFPNPIRRKYIDERPDSEAWEQASRTIRKLADLKDFAQRGAELEAWDKIPAFRFDEDAQQTVKDWMQRLDKRLTDDATLTPLLQEHFAKYRSLMPSIALVFHLVEIAQHNDCMERITDSSARMAVKWCDYLESHARRVYNGLGAVGAVGAVTISERIQRRDLTDGFTQRDIQRKCWSGLNNKKAITAALEQLQDADWIVPMPTPQITEQGGRPPATPYAINPNVFQIVTHN